MYVDHRDAASFLDKCEGHLLQAEAENALVLGIARSIHDDTSKFASPGSPAPRFGHVEIDGSICTTVLQTPPFQLLTTRGEPENMAALADGVLGHGWDGPGVQGEAASVRFFGEACPNNTIIKIEE